MSNAAIPLHPDAFDTSRQRLLGRHSAGESFLRGFFRHGAVDKFHLWNIEGAPRARLDALLARFGAPSKPIHWLERNQRPALREVGSIFLPGPDLPGEAWQRRIFGGRAYSICGVTHTTASQRIMRLLGDFAVAPLDDHDALICTSSAVRNAVETQLAMIREYMTAEYGPRRRAEPQRATIPLGVNVADFATSSEHRRRWRDELQIPDDAVVALYVGRFQVRAKMNPALMARALERAARQTDKTICWVNAGWAETPAEDKEYHDGARALCPSVLYRQVDGRPLDVRFSIWSVGDFFISFSDNIQETFGLTPVEAMAAGLPCVVTDWDGYKDTVRDGQDGFRIPTIAPQVGMGRDLSYWHANDWLRYDHYVGAAAQFVAVDLQAAEDAIARLATDESLRRQLGAQAQKQATEVFDWSAIIPRYQELWGELDARRRAKAAEPAATVDPLFPDPFTLFGGYPTRHISRHDVVSLSAAATWEAAQAQLTGPLAAYSPFNRPTLPEAKRVIDLLCERGPMTVAQIVETFPAGRQSLMFRGLLWLARHDTIAITGVAQ